MAPEAAGAQPLAALITGPLTPAGVLGSQSLAVAEASPTVTLTGTATNAGSTIMVEDYGVPVATAADGVLHRVPHALWIWGRLFDEGTLLRLGRALEQCFATAGTRPPGFG